MKKILIALIVLSFGILGCQKQSESNKAPKLTENKTVNQEQTKSKAKLLFFLNPGGYPCQMQDQILMAMKNELKDKIEVVYIKTSVHEDREKFYSYGIRALPAIILLDKNGNEFKRLPPGIQSKEILTSAISGLN